ncbi:Zn(II)2Cys6 transcription factor domain-containing protein [Aspergillus mulundensis]|uniref:Zn(2)-C6 fungal-type domain-containing protein n=1 Tax=Aspergillus mulundensis TaxID=1810919 RepID=A0A3D8RXU2_9EURO|nr:hypothetical protein DSM5745_05680 [Aspergillus mulundensis]RDW78828.1 hypothetical protein DSM5745_05680 [Aspergillus mulundensis]
MNRTASEDNGPSSQIETNQPLRRHIGKACEGCRQQKIRCNGDSPCERCSRLTLPCIVRRTARQRQKRHQIQRAPDQSNDSASSVILRSVLRPVRVRSGITGTSASRTAVYGPTSTVAALHIIASRSNGDALIGNLDPGIEDTKITVMNSSISLEAFKYHTFVLGNTLTLAPETLTPPLCLTTISNDLLEFFLHRYIDTAWGTLPLQSPAQLTTLFQSSCNAFSQNTLPPVFYPVLLYQLAMGSLSTRHGELSEMLVMESQLLAPTSGGYGYGGLTEEMVLHEIGNFDKAYEILGQTQGRIYTAGYHLDPQAHTLEIKRLLRVLLSTESYVCIAVGRPCLLPSTLRVPLDERSNDSPVTKFVSGLFYIINDMLRAQQNVDTSFEKLYESAWATHERLASFWEENEPALWFAHAEPMCPGGVSEAMELHVVQYIGPQREREQQRASAGKCTRSTLNPTDSWPKEQGWEWQT